MVLTLKILCLRPYHQLRAGYAHSALSHTIASELHSVSLQDGPSVSHLWWLWIVEGHVKKCAVACPNVASRKVEPGEPHWRRSDLLLMNHTWAPKTEATFTLPVWPDPPNNEEPAHQGQIFECIWKEWGAQVANIKRAAAAEAEEANKGDNIAVNKDDSKQATSKPKQSAHHSKKKEEEGSSKIIKPLDDNLNEYFGLSQSQNGQETADVTLVNIPKKSEEAKSKNDPDGSSCQRVDKSPKPSSKLKQSAQDSAVFSHRKAHKSSQGSAGEGSSEPSSKLTQSVPQTMKPESEDSSSLSNSSSGSESSDEEVPSKGKMKELSPPPPLMKRGRSQSPFQSRGKHSKSQSRSHTPKQKND